MNVRTRGFTLIELLIVTLIIGVLAAIAIPKFSEVREKAFIAALKSDLKNLATQQDIYHTAQFSFSTSLSTLQMIESEGVAISINEANGVGWAATAVHAGLTAEQCGLFYGSASPTNGSPGAAEGVVACTY